MSLKSDLPVASTLIHVLPETEVCSFVSTSPEDYLQTEIQQVPSFVSCRWHWLRHLCWYWFYRFSCVQFHWRWPLSFSLESVVHRSVEIAMYCQADSRKIVVTDLLLPNGYRGAVSSDHPLAFHTLMHLPPLHNVLTSDL